MSCTVSVQREDQLPDLVGRITDLQRRNIIGTSPTVSNLLRQCLIRIQNPEIAEILVPSLQSEPFIPEATLEKIKKKMGFGFWEAEFALYGPVSIVEACWEQVKGRFKGLPGVTFTNKLISSNSQDGLAATDLPELAVPFGGVPHVTNMSLMDYRGPGGGHTCFSPILPPSGRELYDLYLKMKQLTSNAG